VKPERGGQTCGLAGKGLPNGSKVSGKPYYCVLSIAPPSLSVGRESYSKSLRNFSIPATVTFQDGQKETKQWLERSSDYRTTTRSGLMNFSTRPALVNRASSACRDRCVPAPLDRFHWTFRPAPCIRARRAAACAAFRLNVRAGLALTYLELEVLGGAGLREARIAVLAP